MSLELRWLHLLLHFKILPTQHLRKQLATFCPMVRVLVYSYEDKALGSNVIIRTCVRLFVVLTTGENGDFSNPQANWSKTKPNRNLFHICEQPPSLLR